MKLKHQNILKQNLKSFSIIKILGEGAWAVVYEAYDENTKSTVAIKAIPKILMKQTPKLEELVRTEIRVLRECKNQNVISFVDNFSSQRSQFIVMEYCNGGDLQQYLINKKRLTEDQANTFLKQILNGFRGLHQVNAMHRDFKAANVLLHDNVCKIADLGFAKQVGEKMTNTILGTSLTMAPQLLYQQKYGMQADIWSVGVVYYQLLYGKYPFVGNSDYQILKKIQTTRPDFKGVNISAKAKDFIDRCLTVNHVNRITWREIYNHPLIKQEQKLMYGLGSKINFKKNQEFYQKEIKINEDYIYAEKKNQVQKKSSYEELIEPTHKVDMQKVMTEAAQKKKISTEIQQHQKRYLNHRNNIMFIFKFVTPHIYTIQNITANHSITLFILSKKAYHQMKTFHNDVKSKNNFLKLNYFHQFVNSPKYNSLIEMTKSDIEIILAQIYSYQQDISSCSNEIKNQYDVNIIKNQNWKQLVDQTIRSYEFQLGYALDDVKGQNKHNLINVIEALMYYKQNDENADIEQFDRKVQTLSYQMEEARIKSLLDEALNNGK